MVHSPGERIRRLGIQRYTLSRARQQLRDELEKRAARVQALEADGSHFGRLLAQVRPELTACPIPAEGDLRQTCAGFLRVVHLHRTFCLVAANALEHERVITGKVIAEERSRQHAAAVALAQVLDRLAGVERCTQKEAATLSAAREAHAQTEYEESRVRGRAAV